MKEKIKNGFTKAKKSIKNFWSENGDKIKIGIKCLCIGAGVGFVYGFNRLTDERIELIKKIPYEPDVEDMYDYIETHKDDKEFMEWMNYARDCCEEDGYVFEDFKEENC